MKMELREMTVHFESNEEMSVQGVVNKPGEYSEVLYSRGKPFVEVIKKGVFKKAIEKAKNIDYLAEHDNKRILASTSNNSLVIEETENGVEMKANIVDTTYGRDAYALIKSGIIGHMSFGFRVLKNSWSKTKEGTPLRIVEDIELFEISSLRNPAYSQSSISARGIEIEDVEVEIMDEIEQRELIEKVETFEIREGDKKGSIEVRSQEDSREANLFFHGYIGSSEWEAEYDKEATVPATIRNALESLKDKEIVNISINSGGGSVYGGLTIYNLLRQLPGKKIVNVDGIAGSIASVIMMAGDEIHINGAVMIHKPLIGGVSGNADALRKMADRLDSAQKMIVDIYMSKAKEGVEKKYINKLVDKETWLTGEEASEIFDVIPTFKFNKPTEDEEKKEDEEEEEDIVEETIVANEEIVEENIVDEVKEEVKDEVEEEVNVVEEEPKEEAKEEEEEVVNEVDGLVDELKALLEKIEASKYKIEEED